MPTLTKSVVERTQPQVADYILWDSKMTGFGVKVTPKGKRVYFLKYRTKDGTQRKPAIGEHSEALTCERAREIAKDWLAEVQQGGDPSGERKTLRKSATVSDLCDRYIKEHALIHKKPSSVYMDRMFIDRYIKPQCGHLKVNAMTRQHVVQLHNAMRHTPIQANRMVNTLSKIFTLAEQWEMRTLNTNPCIKFPRFKETPKERFLTDTEMERLGDTLRCLEQEKKESPYMTALVRILMLTGARLGEILNAKWEWVDMQRGLLTLPDSKTGKRIIKLGAAIDVLEKLPRVAGNPYIIVGEVEGKQMVKPNRQWRRIRQHAGLGDVRMHDLRHTYASVLAMQGESMLVVAKLLGHRQLRTTERYAHIGNNPLDLATQKAGASIAAKVLGR